MFVCCFVSLDKEKYMPKIIIKSILTNLGLEKEVCSCRADT
jgi:hypothetical protein